MADEGQNGPRWVPSFRQARVLRVAKNPFLAKDIRALCKVAGIGHTTFYRWMQRDQGFRGAWDYQRAQVRDSHAPLVDAALLSKAQRGSVPAMRLYYQLRGELKPERHEVTGPGGAPLAAQVEHTGQVAIEAKVEAQVTHYAAGDLGQLAKVIGVLAGAGALGGAAPAEASGEGAKPGDPQAEQG